MTKVKSKLIAFLCAIVMVLGLTLTSLPVFAHAEGTEDSDTDFLMQAQGKTDLDYSIENLNGEIEIIQDRIIVFFDSYQIDISKFDFYKIIDNNGQIRYFQADTDTKDILDNPFGLIIIYLPSADYRHKDYTMEILYGNAVEKEVYNVTVILEDNEIGYFESISENKQLNNDELSLRLINAIRSRDLINEIDYCEINSSQNIALANNTSNYDSYTDSDGIIHSYSQFYFGDYHKNGYITDDPIVRIIPKELFFIPGEHLYVGKEYGFFVKTVHTIGGDQYADVFVFDIFHRLPYFTADSTGTVRITPLFQYKYRTIENISGGSGFDPSLTKVVYPHVNSDAVQYFIGETGFKISLYNPTELYLGDEGYDPNEDEGAFIIQTRVNARGVGAKKKDGDFLQDTLSFAFGYVPYVSDILSIGEYVASVHNGFGNQGYCYSREEWVMDNEANITTYQTNSSGQIDEYHQLLKSVSLRRTFHSDSPRLIHVGGGYVELKYVVARKSNSEYDLINAIRSISVTIVEDNTSRYWFFGWHESGEIYNCGSCTGTYEESSV